MIRFFVKGLLRDRHRSLFPLIIVALGVMLTVLMHCWITGVMGDMVDFNARFATGHVKIMTIAYAENADQLPNDLAIIGADKLMGDLQRDFPETDWVKRIRFGGLVDVPDEQGETRSQGSAMGLAVDLLSPKSREIDRLNIKRALVRGRLPAVSGEILLSDVFAQKLKVLPGDTLTLLGSTMFGSMAMQNYRVSGTVRFGVQVMDRGAVIADVKDIQSMLDMTDAAGEILGFLPGGNYKDAIAREMALRFNRTYSDEKDEFSPKMLSLREQNDLDNLLSYIERMIGVGIAVFVFTMSLVLWNAGLIGGLRRYGEVGVRLAIGEEKGHVYRSMLIESVAIGAAGTIIGTLIGLGLAYLLQTKGIDVSPMLKNTSMMMPGTFRAKITPPAAVIGFLPGLFSTVLGTMLSGIGIYRRKTAQLFKELEV